ncbi:DUF6701 domain-containing protein [Neptunomonas antarctica]|uniref:CUB domain-containing protein n=1 Tax=Neptunomonas antarctica TaxID=619304 RepID=A0A1N7M5X5_9GAMM|nr:DUF6701 domain-containing protein [Neptunomonas antarctica]SIS81536.1 CUB domain-containing protein [Neptunomonas antarctica]
MKYFLFAFLSFVIFFSLSAHAENMCSDASSSASSGNLYDSGGSGNKYSEHEDCTFLIQPAGASSITLTFSDFKLKNKKDFVYLYNGTSTGSPLIAALTGNSAGVYTVSSGAMLVRFTSEKKDKGFSATWAANIPTPSTPVVQAAWYFDENKWAAVSGEVLDSSGNNYHGVASEPMTNSTDGVVCNSADFRDDGTSDYVSLNSSALNGLNDFSVSVWGKLDSTRRGAQTIFSAASSSDKNGVLMFFSSTSSLSFYFRNTVVASFSLTAISDDLWHHYVWARKEGKHCLFLDGESQGCKTSSDAGAVSIDPGGLIIGQEQDSVGGRFDGSQDWEGLVDELMVFGSELSAAQVSIIYDNQAAGKNYDGTSRRCDLPSPVVDYRFDSCNWTDAQNVIDSSPNHLDAYAVNGVLSTVGGQVCGLARFDSANDYVRLSDSGSQQSPVDLPDTLTAMAWVYLKNTPSGLKSILSKDTNYEFHIDSNRQVNWWWRDSDNSAHSFSSGTQIALNQWHHVAIVYQSGLQIIYVDGAEAARQTFTGALLTNNNDLQIGQDQGIQSRFFDGDIDEVKIFSIALTLFEIEDIYDNEKAGLNYDGEPRSCACVEPVAVDHYAITHDLFLVSCMVGDVTFTAHDKDHRSVNAGSAQLQISTSTNKGEWSLVDGAFGDLNNAGSGRATYQFGENESTVTLRFSYPDLASDPELVNFNVFDGFSSDKRVSSDVEDRDLSVSDSGLVFTIPDTESCQSSATVSVRAVKKSDNSLGCSRAVAGDRTVNFYSQYIAPETGTHVPVITSQGEDYTLATNASGTAVTMSFSDQGEASMKVRYSDAGLIGLHASLVTDAKTLTGFGSFVAYPAQLKGTAAAKSPAGDVMTLGNSDVSGGAVWASARPFSLGVAGQCADGSVTPNYQPSNAELGATLNAPTTDATGGLLSMSSGTNIIVSDAVGWVGISAGFSDGVFQDSAAKYSEVGIINLYARDADFYGHNITQSIMPIGRFIPWFFKVAANTPAWSSHCPSGDFSYLDEKIEYQTPPELTVSAYNAAGNKVNNYGNDFWKLSPQRASRFYTDQAAAGVAAVLVVSPVNASMDKWGGTESDYDGVAINTLSGDTIMYSRIGLEAPFYGFTDLTFTSADLTDEDGVCYRVDSDGDGDWLDESCEKFTIVNIPTKELRFGRLGLVGAYGPETEALPVPLLDEYYNGSGFVTNTSDSCSAWLITPEVSLSDIDGTLVASGQTVASYAYPAADFRGDVGMTMSSPGVGNIGVVRVDVNLTRLPYFYFDWDGDGSYDDEPSANIVFGQYRNHDKVIFQRQW